MGSVQQVLLGLGGAAVTNPNDPGGVSPADLSGLELWLKANNDQFDSTADDTQITGNWNDSSGNARNAAGVAAGSPSTYPKFKLAQINTYPAIRMVSSDAGLPGGWFTLPDFLTGFTSGEYFAVAKLDFSPTVQNGATPLGDWCSGTDDSYMTFTTDGKLYEQWGTTVRKNTITISGLDSWFMYNVRNASAAYSIFKNGTSLFSTGTNTVGWGTGPKVGRVTGSSKHLRGLIAEIIFYSRVLTSSERFDTVHTYLNNKYNLGLPTS